MQELEKGSGVGRSELFPIAHMKKDGTPVNEEAREAIVSISVLVELWVRFFDLYILSYCIYTVEDDGANGNTTINS